jgi:hypothetical protein
VEAAEVVLAALRPHDRFTLGFGRHTVFPEPVPATPVAKLVALRALTRARPMGTDPGPSAAITITDRRREGLVVDDSLDARHAAVRAVAARLRPPASAIDLGGEPALPLREGALWTDVIRVAVRSPAAPRVSGIAVRLVEDPSVATFWYAERGSDELSRESGVLGPSMAYLFWRGPKGGETERNPRRLVARGGG